MKVSDSTHPDDIYIPQDSDFYDGIDFNDDLDVEVRDGDDDDSRDGDYKPRQDSDSNESELEEDSKIKGNQAVKSLFGAVDEDFFNSGNNKLTVSLHLQSPQRPSRPPAATKKFTTRKPYSLGRGQ